MTVVTWLAILVLGPGSVVVFAFFLRDLERVMGGRRERHTHSKGVDQGPS